MRRRRKKVVGALLALIFRLSSFFHIFLMAIFWL
jgi:hypothetical protein